MLVGTNQKTVEGWTRRQLAGTCRAPGNDRGSGKSAFWRLVLEGDVRQVQVTRIHAIVSHTTSLVAYCIS